MQPSKASLETKHCMCKEGGEGTLMLNSSVEAVPAMSGLKFSLLVPTAEAELVG